jgi:hypothetical protein
MCLFSCSSTPPTPETENSRDGCQVGAPAKAGTGTAARGRGDERLTVTLLDVSRTWMG